MVLSVSIKQKSEEFLFVEESDRQLTYGQCREKSFVQSRTDLP